ncbi:MAG: hypothetical protein ABH854_01335 [Candidatus Diapherotrites archaeon]
MNVVTVSEKKGKDVQMLTDAFLKKGFERAPFIGVSKLGLITKKSGTRIVVGKLNFRKYDAVFLKAGPHLTQFIEPFLDNLVESGIYCQLKPESYYVTSNKPFMYATLNAAGIPMQKTTIIQSVEMIEQAVKGFKFPLLFKTFSGHEKLQHVIMDSERGLMSMAKGVKEKAEAILLQEYLEGDLDYCFVIGRETFSVKRKWDDKKMEHLEKGVSSTLDEDAVRIASKAARAVGADIATVKMINGRVIDVSPEIELERFNKILCKELQENIASHYMEVLTR